MGRAFDIVCGYLLDELWNVDARWAGFCTRCIIAEQATVGFYQSCILCFKWRMDVGEVLLVLFWSKAIICYHVILVFTQSGIRSKEAKNLCSSAPF